MRIALAGLRVADAVVACMEWLQLLLAPKVGGSRCDCNQTPWVAALRWDQD